MARPKRNATDSPEALTEHETTPAVAQGYETFDGNEALAYNQAGGRLIAVTARYPSKIKGAPSLKPGKRYRFLETKAELDRLLAEQQTEEARG